MTNKEAIKYLIVPTATSTEPGAEYLKQREAYDLAIKALEDEKLYNFVSSPTEVVKVGEPIPNSDEINKTLEKGELYKRGFKEGYKQAIIDGKAQYQRPHGKWIYKCCYGDEFPQCSNCGEIFDEKSNFCPDCGADMRKGGEEE